MFKKEGSHEMLDKKTDILLAARKLFSEKDFTSVSMQAIAEECKMSKASIYKLFQSKEDLLLELLSFNQKQMVAAASRLQENTALTPEERLTQRSKWNWRASGGISSFSIC